MIAKIAGAILMFLVISTMPAQVQSAPQRPQATAVQTTMTNTRPDTEIERQRIQIHKTVLSSRCSTGPVATPWHRFTATWYSYEGGCGTGRITATGAHVRDGYTVAVDPRIIPLGSIIEVRFANGTTHVYKAQDTGGAIHGTRIDVFDSNRRACLQNGRQTVWIKILVRGK